MLKLVFVDGVADEHSWIEEQQTCDISRNGENKFCVIADHIVEFAVIIYRLQLVKHTIQVVRRLISSFWVRRNNFLDVRHTHFGFATFVETQQCFTELLRLDDGFEEYSGSDAHWALTIKCIFIAFLWILGKHKNITCATANVDA